MYFSQSIAVGVAYLTLALAQCSTTLNISTTTFNATTTTATATFSTTTCLPRSIDACPTPYDPCCAFICAEAQVPFAVCLPTNQTVLAQCSACPSPTPAP